LPNSGGNALVAGSADGRPPLTFSSAPGPLPPVAARRQMLPAGVGPTERQIRGEPTLAGRASRLLALVGWRDGFSPAPGGATAALRAADPTARIACAPTADRWYCLARGATCERIIKAAPPLRAALYARRAPRRSWRRRATHHICFNRH